MTENIRQHKHGIPFAINTYNLFYNYQEENRIQKNDLLNKDMFKINRIYEFIINM